MAINWNARKADLKAQLLVLKASGPLTDAQAFEALADALLDVIKDALDEAVVTVSGETHAQQHDLTGTIE